MAQYDNVFNSLKGMIPLDMIKEEDIISIKFKDVAFCEDCKESKVKIANLEGKIIHLEIQMVKTNNLYNALRTEYNEKVQVVLKEVNNAFQFGSSLQVERRERVGETSQLKDVIDSIQKDIISFRNQLHNMGNINKVKCIFMYKLQYGSERLI